jgi:hypothetical protein
LESNAGYHVENPATNRLICGTAQFRKYLFIISHGVRLSPLGTEATVWPIVPSPDGDDYDDDCEAIDGM